MPPNRTPPRISAKRTLGCLMICLAGCSKNDGIRLYPATGTVMLDGKPVANASVTFNPALLPSFGKLATGKTDQQGRFTIYTDGRPGAGVATYTVTVFAQEEGSTSGPNGSLSASPADPATRQSLRKQPKLLVPERYTTPVESDLSVGVGLSGNHFELKLTTEKAK